MASEPTQKNRQLAIETALGADVVMLRALSVQEQLGRPFTIEVELASRDGELKFDDIVGTAATIRLELPNKATRYFNGVVSRFTQGANRGGYAQYRATLVPWLWLLTRTSDCRIFQKKSVPEILEEVFKGHGLNDYELKLSESYVTREFCVQYRETDFNFVSRLMEQEGIYYYFTHEHGKHTLVLADAASAHGPFPEYAEIEFYELEKGAETREVITDWQVEKSVQPGACVLNDFDFTKPKSSLRTVANVTRSHAASDFEVYDYPGEYVVHGEGERLAKVRLEEFQSQHEICKGQGTSRGLAAGHTFTLQKHPRDDQNREYLITRVALQAEAGEYGSGGQDGGGFFSCNVEAIDKAQTFRVGQVTPKPIVQGPQTAIVVGPGGEEIYTDDQARVKVHFHWDRHGAFDENASCWIRVSQSNAGKGWGSMITPRIGQEVIVEFLEGDPDRPIITGRVYNGDNAPPYAGGQGVVSGLKSQTHKGSGYNEISMDDTAGKEKFVVHGQYDMSTKVGNDQTNDIGNNRTTTVAVNDTESIGSNQEITVGSNQKLTIGADQEISVGAKQTESVGADQSLSVGANQTVAVSANAELSVGGNHAVSVSGNQETDVGGNRAASIGANDEVKAGAKIVLDAGAEVSINSGAKITLSAGGSTIEIGPSGVTIQTGAKVTVQGSMINLN